MVTGLAGLILAGLWGLTDHVMAYRNENLLQLESAGARAAAGRVGGGPRRGDTAMGPGSPRRWRGCRWLGLALKLLPGFDQVNGPIIALALPAQLGVAVRAHALRLPAGSSVQPAPATR